MSFDHAGPWHVLLLGGASGSGKSHVCSELMQRRRVGCAEVDDVHAALSAIARACTCGAFHPEVNATSSGVGADAVLQQLRSSGEAMLPAIRAVVDSHLDHGPPVILEGDFLLPGIVDDVSEGWSSVRTVFLFEPSEEQIVANYLQREPERGPQLARAHASWRWGSWLRDEARARGLPVVETSPRSSLDDRLWDLLQTP